MIDKSKIPSSWEVVKLGEVCSYSKGKKPVSLSAENNSKNNIPYINIKAFEKGIFDEYTDGEKCNLCEDGDLLMVWDGARCGLIGKAKNGAVGSTLMKILPKENIHKEYLYHFISSKFWTLNTKPKGVGIPHIEPTLLWNFELVVPPHPEQQAIVSKIEELLSDLENGKQQLQTAQQQLKVYRQSLLKWAFEGKLTNKKVKDGELPKGWKWVTINEIGKIKGGKRLPPKHQYSEEPTDYVYIMAGNLKEGTVKNKPTYIKEETYNALSHYRVTGGEVYITIVGACIGDAGVIPENIGKSILTENAAKIVELKDIQNKYLALWINSLTCQLQIKRKILSATLGKLALNRIGTLEIPLSTLEEQQHIVDELESKLTVCDKIEETISQSLKQAETLRQSILKKAFEGKLVAQNHNDEPAPKLLERIKAESQKNEVEKKKSRRDDMIIGKNHKIISNPEGVIYNGNNGNISPLRG